MNEIVADYYEKLAAVQDGQMAETEWRDYCLDLLADLMLRFDEFERDLRGE